MRRSIRRLMVRALSLENLESRHLFAGFTDLLPSPSDIDQPGFDAVALLGMPLAEGEGEDRYIGGHDDPFLPNFSHPENSLGRRIVNSIANGNWASQFANTGEEDIIVIRHHVVISGSITAYSVVVAPGGTLEFSRTVGTQLRVVNLQVLEHATLDAGTELSPIQQVTVEIIVRSRATESSYDPFAYGTGFTAFGTVHMHGRKLESTFVESASEFRSGQTQLPLDSSLTNWQVGDRILIPDTRQVFYTANNYAELNQYEIARVKGLNDNRVTLESALAFNHLGARDENGQLVFNPHAANLTRTVIIRSENPSGTRGHTMFSGHGDIDIRYVEFRELGRTTNAEIDNSVIDGAGRLLRLGNNQVGRYPLHIHHVIGPANPQANGFQYTVVGNSVYGNAMAAKWGIAIHASHYGLISENIVYNMSGAGIATEDGSESFNRISGNFISRISGTRDRGKFTDGREGSGIWLRRPNNYVDDNVVTGATKSAYALYGGDNTPANPVAIPLFQGAHPAHGEFRLVKPESMVLLSFDGNEAYASHMGVEFWYMGFEDYYSPTRMPLPMTTISNLDLWHIDHTGIFANQLNVFCFEDIRIVGDRNQLGLYNYPTGVLLGTTIRVEFERLSIANQRIGLQAPWRTAELNPSLKLEDVSPLLLDGGKFSNELNILITTPILDVFTSFGPRAILIKDIVFEESGRVLTGGANIVMNYDDGRFANLIQKDLVQVVNYDNSDLSFRLYYHQQAPGYIVPRTGSRSDLGPNSPLGAPVDGLTNQQTWDRYKIAIGGQVAPGNANHRDALQVPGVSGLAFPENAIPEIVSISPDTGRNDDLITSATAFALRGKARPLSSVTVFENNVGIGSTSANANGEWTYDFTSAPGISRNLVFTSQSNLGGSVSDRSQSVAVKIRSQTPVLIDKVFEIYDDTAAGSKVGDVMVQDGDEGDSALFSLASGSQFTVDGATGALFMPSTLARGEYAITVNVVDSAGLSTSKSYRAIVLRRPPGDWITRLHYTEFSRLNAIETPFLTRAQVASIPSAFFFAQMTASARAALTNEQVQALNLAPLGMIGLLTAPQRGALSVAQVRSLSFVDFRFLLPAQVELLTPQQIASIPDAWTVSGMGGALAARITQTQVPFLNVGAQGMIAWLSPVQRGWLTETQVRSLRNVDFQFLNPQQIPILSTAQISTLSTWWLSLIPATSRGALTGSQVKALRIEEGMVRLLNWNQSEGLLDAQVARIGFSDFPFLSTATVLRLSNSQLLTIPSRYQFYLFSSATINALAAVGVRWVDGRGVVITR